MIYARRLKHVDGVNVCMWKVKGVKNHLGIPVFCFWIIIEDLNFVWIPSNIECVIIRAVNSANSPSFVWREIKCRKILAKLQNPIVALKMCERNQSQQSSPLSPWFIFIFQQLYSILPLSHPLPLRTSNHLHISFTHNCSFPFFDILRRYAQERGSSEQLGNTIYQI